MSEPFAHEARRILARARGFNERSLRLLANAARRWDIPLDQVASRVARPTGPAPDPVLPARTARQAVAPLRESWRLKVPFNAPAPTARPAPADSPLTKPQIPGLPVAPLPPISALPAPALPRGPVPSLNFNPRSASDAPKPSNQPLDDEIDPAARTMKLAGVVVVIALVGLVLGLTSVWMIVRSLSAPRAPIAADTTSAGRPAETKSTAQPKPDDRSKTRSSPTGELFPAPKPSADHTPKDAAASPPTPSEDPVALVRELTSLSESVDQDPAAAGRRFIQLIDALGHTWTSLPADQLAHSQDSIVEFVYRASRTPDIAIQAVEAIAAPARAGSAAPGAALAPSIWSFGTLTRLSQERDLPAGARQIVDSTLAALPVTPGVNFTTGATAALTAWPRAAVRSTKASPSNAPRADAWKTWLLIVNPVLPDGPARARLVLAALETYLAEGAEPPDADSVAVLVGATPWRAADESRPRLIRWFDNPAVSAADLHAVTVALARGSAAEGVDVTMVLGRAADEPPRRELRERYIAAWALADTAARDALVIAWAEAAKAYLEQAADLTSPVQQLARSVVLSRLNEAAGRIWAGQPEGVGVLIRDADKPVAALLAAAAASPPPVSLDENASDGAWTLRYLDAEKNIPQRASLLAELAAGAGPIGPIDAETIAADAFRGAPAQIRRSAQDIVRKFSSSPAMVNAVLEQSIHLPKSSESADLLHDITNAVLPPLRSPSWPVAVRRALVERLLELIASRAEQGLVDTLADLLAQSYLARAVAAPADAPTPAADKKPSPEVAIRAARLSWTKWAQALTPTGSEPASLDDIRRRVAGRLTLASGLTQTFAAEQDAVAELMAYVVAAEKPANADAARRIDERLASERRRADHVFTQMLAAERAMCELWALRLDVTIH